VKVQYKLLKTNYFDELVGEEIKGLRGIEWANLGAEGARKLCIS
jgi:hypothetical protein